MADALGQPGQAEVYRSDAANLRTAINRYLLDPVDRALRPLRPPARRRGPGRQRPRRALRCGPDGRGRHHPGRAGQGPAVDAVRSAAVQRQRPPTAPRSVRSSPTRKWTLCSPPATPPPPPPWCAPSGGTWTLPGPDDTGADWELVGADGSPGFGASTSLAHGWASGATAALSSYVLGVRPSSAGFRTWSVTPHAGTLSWVEGDVPTPHGTIEVRLSPGPVLGSRRPGGRRPRQDHRHHLGARPPLGCGRHHPRHQRRREHQASAALPRQPAGHRLPRGHRHGRGDVSHRGHSPMTPGSLRTVPAVSSAAAATRSNPGDRTYW